MDPRGDKRKQDSMISHIISGGTPLDPAPPPFELANFGEDSVYTLVLLRHGESEWNKLNQILTVEPRLSMYEFFALSFLLFQIF